MGEIFLAILDGVFFNLIAIAKSMLCPYLLIWICFSTFLVPLHLRLLGGLRH
jgi:hypothetical protein